MRYMIIQEGYYTFLTNWYEYENHYIEGMIIVDLAKKQITKDGVKWEQIQEDKL